MAYSLNNIPAPDAYIDASTLECPGSTRLNLIVTTAAIYVQTMYGMGLHNSGAWDTEIMYVPGYYGRALDFSAVRFRAVVPGLPQPAQVIISAY